MSDWLSPNPPHIEMILSKEQELENESITEFLRKCRMLNAPWFLKPIIKDYDFGEDIDVELKEGQELKVASFKIQMKATEGSPHKGNMNYRIQRKHIVRWREMDAMMQVYLCKYFKEKQSFYIRNISEWIYRNEIIDDSDEIIDTQKTFKVDFDESHNIENTFESITSNVKEKFRFLQTIQKEKLGDDSVTANSQITLNPKSEFKPYLSNIKNSGPQSLCGFISVLDAWETMSYERTEYSVEYLTKAYKEIVPDYEITDGVKFESVFKTLEEIGTIRKDDEGQNLKKQYVQKYKLTSWSHINIKDTNLIKVLLDRNLPIILGIKIFRDFLLYESGIYLPKIDDFVGYHAICVVGYTQEGLIIRNSWGKNWGMNGTAILAYDYLEHAHSAYVINEPKTTDNNR